MGELGVVKRKMPRAQIRRLLTHGCLCMKEYTKVKIDGCTVPYVSLFEYATLADRVVAYEVLCKYHSTADGRVVVLIGLIFSA